MIYSYNYNICS